VQKVSKVRLGASKSFREFSTLFWDLFSFDLSYFYLLEGSKIFFLCSKYFIWIAQVPMCLWEFSWNFWDFLTIFRALKYFVDFFWNYLCTGKYFGKKTYPTILGRAPGPDPTRFGPAARPAKAQRPSRAWVSPPSAGVPCALCPASL
jgi:hypothetical protein